jgi:hypothetical protein
MFRVGRHGQGIDDVDSIEGARENVRGQPSVRDDEDEVRADPCPSSHTGRSRGRMISHPGGRVVDRPWPLRPATI